MWLYFDSNGILKTSLLHGQVVRQGNGFDLYICFPSDLTSFAGRSVKVEFEDENGNAIGEAATVSSEYYENIAFHKISANEATFAFVDNQLYPCYYAHIPYSLGATNSYGMIYCIITLLSNGSNEDFILGRVPISVEKTFGKNSLITITASQYQRLMAAIGSKETAGPIHFSNVESMIGQVVSDTNEISLVYYNSIGIIYGTFTTVMGIESSWTEIARYDTQGLINLKAKSVSIGNNSTDSDAEIRLVQNYTNNNDGTKTPSTISVQINNCNAGETIQFSAPVILDDPNWDSADSSLGTVYVLKTDYDAFKSDVEANYVKSSDLSQEYLTIESAQDTYLTKVDALSTYLTKSDASSTYLTASSPALNVYAKTEDLTSQTGTKVARAGHADTVDSETTPGIFLEASWNGASAGTYKSFSLSATNYDGYISVYSNTSAAVALWVLGVSFGQLSLNSSYVYHLTVAKTSPNSYYYKLEQVGTSSGNIISVKSGIVVSPSNLLSLEYSSEDSGGSAVVYVSASIATGTLAQI